MPNHAYITEWHPNIIGVGPNFPALPFKFQRWWISDSGANNLTLYYHNGTSWVPVGNTTKATDTIYGQVKLSLAPATAGVPIAVGDNDTRMTNSRTPTGSANGDVTGTFPGSLVVSKINGTSVGAAPATAGLFLISTGSAASTWQQLILLNAGSAPATPANGQVYVDTSTNRARAFINTAWRDFVTDNYTFAGEVTGTPGATTLATIGAGATVNYPSQIIYNTRGLVTGSTPGTSPSATAVGGDVSGTVASISLPNKGVAGTYNNPTQIITDSKGAVTSATAGTAPVTSATGSGPIASTGGTTPVFSWNPTAAFSNNGQQVTNFLFENLASAPTGVVGRAYVDTTGNSFRVYMNGAWRTLADVAAVVNSITFNAPFGNSGTATAPVPTLAITPASPGGAIALQAATPGSVQASANGHIDGTFIADTKIQSTTVNGSTAVQVNGININPVPKNWIINGNMDVCQRYGPGGSAVIAATTTGKPEVVDRWRHRRDGTGATVTVNQQAFTIGQTAVPGEPTYFLRHNQTVAGSGGTLNYIQQWIEDVRTFAGQTITVSGYLAADATRTVNVRYRQFFGTGGSADVVAGSSVAVNVTTIQQKWTASFVLPSISGKTITADSALVLEFVLPNNTVMTIDLAQVQLEAGGNAGPFQKKSFAEELLACKRYYQKSFTYATAPADGTGSNVGAFRTQIIVAGVTTTILTGQFQIPMRVLPTMVYYNPRVSGTAGQATNLNATSDGTATATGGPASENVIAVNTNGLAAWAAGQTCAVHWTAEDPNI